MRTKIARGSVFQQAYRDRHGERRKTSVWYLKYYVLGKPVVVPAETTDYDEAVALLREKMAGLSKQGHLAERPERVRMEQLFDLLLDWYRLHERRSTYDVECKIKSRLRPWFGRMKAQAITSRELARYISGRLKEKPIPATGDLRRNASINRELAYVRRAMKLGADQDPPVVLRVPKFEMLPEAEPREGTLAHDGYRAVRDLLPGYARIALVIAYHSARKGEICKIQKDRIDLKAKRIDVPGRTTKSKRPRFLPIYGDMGGRD